MGAPTQPGAAPWPGAEDSSAASPQPTPPTAAFSYLPLNSALFPPRDDYRHVAETRDPATRPPALLPRDCQPLEKREKCRKDRWNTHRRSQAAVNFHSPLPAAGLPASLRLLVAPAPTSSVHGCAFSTPLAALPVFPLPSLAWLAGSHTPKTPRQRNAWRGEGRSDRSAERFLWG